MTRKLLSRLPAGSRSAAIGILLAGLAIAGSEPSSPKAQAPPGEFSAIRARRVLDLVAGSGRPRPEGSPESGRVIGLLVDELRALGDSPVVEKSFACNAGGVCGEVRNIVVRRPGRESRKSILFSAHHDSVAAGPGASDDGLGVAALLEIARALRASPLDRPVTFLLDDGEEQGLLGAEAFAARSPVASGILADINLEARGTGGPSLLFETSAGNAWLARKFSALPHPVTSSLFYAVYKALPNDTDLTVFRRRGMAGVNFGCVRGVSRYHTPRDDVKHASLATLQHHGDNALALARALDSADADASSSGDAVYFDLFGKWIVRWSAALCLPLAIAAAAIFAFGLALSRRGIAPAGIGFAALLVVPAMIAAAAAGGLLLSFLLRRSGATPAGWVAHPFAPAAALWTAALASAGSAAARIGRRTTPEAIRLAGAAWGIAAAILVAAVLPAASFPFLVPAVLWGATSWPRVGRFAPAAARVAAAFFWLPIAWALLDVLGFGGAGVIGALLGLVASGWAAEIAFSDSRRRHLLGWTFALGIAVFAGASLLASPFTSDVPQRVTFLAHHDADSGRSRWVAETDAGSLPPPVARRALFRREPEFPWSPSVFFVADAPPLALPPPEFRIFDDSLSGGVRRVRGKLVSPRGAVILRAAFPPESRPRSVVFGGVGFPSGSVPSRGLRPGWSSYVCVTTPPGGIDFEIAAPPGPITMVLSDRSTGLPESAAALLGSRPAWAVPSQSGDGTVVTRSLRF